MTTPELAALAKRISNRVRILVPRSSNRFLDAETGATDWLRDTTVIRYTNFIQKVARLKTKGATQPDLETVSTKRRFCVLTKKVSGNASVKELKDAVAGFLQHGQVDGKPVDVGYKPSMSDEKAYSVKFSAALADYMNAQGFRKKNGVKFAADRVMDSIATELIMADRGLQMGISADQRPALPITYVASSARNAFRFGIGNCEECACAAFAMFLATPVAEDATPIRVELVYGKCNVDAHFFVIVNRTGAHDIFTDLDRWYASPKVVACDPWITDEGVGGLITSRNDGMGELRSFLKPVLQKGMPNQTGLTDLEVRTTGYVGGAGSLSMKDHADFHLPN